MKVAIRRQPESLSVGISFSFVIFLLVAKAIAMLWS